MSCSMERVRPKEVVATTYQAISGAGKTFKDWPEMVENIIPYIGGEEERVSRSRFVFLEHMRMVDRTCRCSKITCQCLRVPVLNGHTAAVFINFEKKPTKEQLIEKLESFSDFRRRLDFQVHQSSLSVTWKKTTVRR